MSISIVKSRSIFEIMIRGYKLLLGILKDNLQKEKASNAIEEIRADGLYTLSVQQRLPEIF